MILLIRLLLEAAWWARGAAWMRRHYCEDVAGTILGAEWWCWMSLVARETFSCGLSQKHVRDGLPQAGCGSVPGLLRLWVEWDPTERPVCHLYLGACCMCPFWPRLASPHIVQVCIFRFISQQPAPTCSVLFKLRSSSCGLTACLHSAGRRECSLSIFRIRVFSLFNTEHGSSSLCFLQYDLKDRRQLSGVRLHSWKAFFTVHWLSS